MYFHGVSSLALLLLCFLVLLRSGGVGDGIGEGARGSAGQYRSRIILGWMGAWREIPKGKPLVSTFVGMLNGSVCTSIFVSLPIQMS